METDTLHKQIRLDFFEKVYSGEIAPYQVLPAERKEAEALSVSRGTVRKARKILEEEGYISNTQGSGAVYTPLENRKSAPPEIVAVVVPVHNPFFMSFYRAFEKEAENNDLLVVIKQLDYHNADRMNDVLFSLFLKGIKDIVFWPYDTILDYQHIQRLSGLGMNVIFFDSVHDFAYCDYVSVDNRHAISSLYAYLKRKNSERIAYIGWKNSLLTSNTEREKRFLEIKSAGDRVLRLPWNQEFLTEEQLDEAFKLIQKGEIDGFLCGNGHIGIVLRKYLITRGYSDIPICTIDNFAESESLELTVYEQPFELMGHKTFASLKKRSEQMRTKESVTHYIKGKVIER